MSVAEGIRALLRALRDNVHPKTAVDEETRKDKVSEERK